MDQQCDLHKPPPPHWSEDQEPFKMQSWPFNPLKAIWCNFEAPSHYIERKCRIVAAPRSPPWLPSHNPPIYGCLEAAPEWGLENREIYEIGQLLFHRAVPKHQLRPDISHLRFNLLLEREGNYEISAVKVIEVTNDYLGLDGEIRKCQNKESFENCTTRQYLSTVKSVCNCIPYELKRFVTQMVKYH